MDPNTKPEIAVDCYPFVRIYKDGRIERLAGNDIVPASLKPQNGVVSKDVVYSPENNLSVRLFIPQKTLESANPHQKLPVLVYFHGGAFMISSPFRQLYTKYLTDVVAAAKCVAVSVEYRRAPENPLPIPYEDSWEALNWVWSHSGGTGPDDWLNRHGDFNRLFLSGDSAGGNIAYNMGLIAGAEGKIRILGIFLSNPSFWTEHPFDENTIQGESMRDLYRKVRKLVISGSIDGNHGPFLDFAMKKPKLEMMGGRKMFVIVAEKDYVAPQGWDYVRRLKESGWKGELEVFEAIGERHVFHLKNPNSENSKIVFEKFVGFINKK